MKQTENYQDVQTGLGAANLVTLSLSFKLLASGIMYVSLGDLQGFELLLLKLTY